MAPPLAPLGRGKTAERDGAGLTPTSSRSAVLLMLRGTTRYFAGAAFLARTFLTSVAATGAEVVVASVVFATAAGAVAVAEAVCVAAADSGVTGTVAVSTGAGAVSAGVSFGWSGF